MKQQVYHTTQNFSDRWPHYKSLPLIFFTKMKQSKPLGSRTERDHGDNLIQSLHFIAENKWGQKAPKTGKPRDRVYLGV